MQCADGKTVGTRRRRGRREVVPGVSSLTTCDELREARNEIKRVPENLRGSARSNYLHEARGVEDCEESRYFFFLRHSFILPQFLPSHFLRRVYHAIQTCAMKGGPSKRNYSGLLFALGFVARWWRRREEGEREDNEERRTHGTQYDA